jgi:hypothetical protein
MTFLKGRKFCAARSGNKGTAVVKRLNLTYSALIHVNSFRNAVSVLLPVTTVPFYGYIHIVRI